MLQWLRDALRSPEPCGSSRMVVGEGGTEHLPAGKVPGETAATSRPRQL